MAHSRWITKEISILYNTSKIPQTLQVQKKVPVSSFGKEIFRATIIWWTNVFREDIGIKILRTYQSVRTVQYHYNPYKSKYPAKPGRHNASRSLSSTEDFGRSHGARESVRLPLHFSTTHCKKKWGDLTARPAAKNLDNKKHKEDSGLDHMTRSTLDHTCSRRMEGMRPHLVD
jgi:hypothetical protein